METQTTFQQQDRIKFERGKTYTGWEITLYENERTHDELIDEIQRVDAELQKRFPSEVKL